MFVKFILTLVIINYVIVNGFNTITSLQSSMKLYSPRMKTITTTSMSHVEKDNNKNKSIKDFMKVTFATVFAVGSFANNVWSADYAPSSAPPQLTPQVARQAPRAVQPGVPEKWIYSKFLDEVEKNDVI
jgi:hypothetical protein